jgi:hypothetical protein
VDNQARFASSADVDSSGIGAAMATVRMWDAVPAARTPSSLASPRAFMPPTQIVFIEANVPDAQDLLLFGVQPGVEAGLDLAQDGVQQIATHLASHDIQSLAGIDTWADGAIPPGTAMLRSATLADYQPSRAQVGVVLTTGAAIQAGGCHVGQDAAGVAFLDLLSQATGGASIAAASHIVGDAADGSSFNLNVNVGASDPLNALQGGLALSVTCARLYAVMFDADSASNTRLEQVAANSTSFVAGGSIDLADAASNNDGVPPAIGATNDVTITASGTISISAGSISAGDVATCTVCGCPSQGTGTGANTPDITPPGPTLVAGAGVSGAPIAFDACRTIAEAVSAKPNDTTVDMVRYRPAARTAISRATITGVAAAAKQPMPKAAAGDIRDPAVDTVSRCPAERLAAVGFPGRRPMQNGARRQPALDNGSPAFGAAHAARVHRRVAFDQRYHNANNKFGNVGQ